MKAAASAPVRLKLTVPPCTSLAAAVYTAVAVLVPSGTVTLVELVIAGATSITPIVTACDEVSVPSEAMTLKLYEDFVSKSGEALKVTAPRRRIDRERRCVGTAQAEAHRAALDIVRRGRVHRRGGAGAFGHRDAASRS